MQGCKPLSDAEVKRVAAAFTGRAATRNAALFTLGLSTGFRASELLSLRLRDILTEEGAIVDRVTVWRRSMKRKKASRSVLVNAAAKRALRPYLEELRERGIVAGSRPLFGSPRNPKRPIGRVQFWRLIHKAAEAAEVKGRIGTHTMRKTFANRIYSHFLNQVAEGQAVDAFRSTSKALGHADIKSTDLYLSFLDQDVDQAVAAIGEKP